MYLERADTTGYLGVALNRQPYGQSVISNDLKTMFAIHQGDRICSSVVTRMSYLLRFKILSLVAWERLSYSVMFDITFLQFPLGYHARCRFFYLFNKDPKGQSVPVRVVPLSVDNESVVTNGAVPSVASLASGDVSDTGLLSCTYEPYMVGPHVIHVMFAGVEVENSPFTVQSTATGRADQCQIKGESQVSVSF